MLSVARGAAEAAERAAVATASLSAVLDDAVAGAVAALAATPDQLPILKQAGVVDAGGHGIVLILRACRDFARGDTDGVTATASDAVPVGEAMEFFDNLDDLHEADEFGYCTNFMVFADGLDFARERDAIAAMGQSAVIVGDESMLKVHIHTEHPGEVLEYAIGLGELDQVRIDSMTRRTRLLEGQRANARAAHENGLVLTRTPETKLAILAVASGEGISDALRSMGASGIVPGGQTMNPSTEEMLAAVNAVDNESVLLLPNNRNILMAASQVPMLTDKAIRIVPTRSIPQGLASLAAYNDELSLDANLKAMTAAAAGVTTVELVRAVRNAKIGQIKVRRGQILGLHDEAIVAAGDDEVDVLRAAVASADHQDAELVTIFTGEGVTDAEADAVRRACAALLPGAEIESHPGGQPHIRFIISIE